MTVVEVVTMFTPLVVFGVIEGVKWLAPKVPGWAIVTVFVPALSVGVTLITQYMTGATDFWIQAGLGLLAVTVSEVLKQLKQINMTAGLGLIVMAVGRLFSTSA